MSVGNRIDSTLGVVTTKDGQGTVIAKDNNVGFGPYRVDSIGAILSSSTAANTLTANDAGVLTISGSAVTVVVMPLASACAGAEFIFRQVSNNAAVLTGSQETAGVKVFADGMVLSGSKLTLSGTIGQSVGVKSNGLQYLVTMATSGALGPGFGTAGSYLITGT